MLDLNGAVALQLLVAAVYDAVLLPRWLLAPALSAVAVACCAAHGRKALRADDPPAPAPVGRVRPLTPPAFACAATWRVPTAHAAPGRIARDTAPMAPPNGLPRSHLRRRIRPARRRVRYVRSGPDDHCADGAGARLRAAP